MRMTLGFAAKTALLGLSCLVFLGVVMSADPPADEAKKDKILKVFAEEFVSLTPGTGKFPASFRMGSEGTTAATEQPIRTVTFLHPFAMAKVEVTQEAYETVVGRNPSKWKGPRNSVEMVDWNEANSFCAKVTIELRKRKLLAENETIRLPSEAEWEYACRAGTTSAYSFGDKIDNLKDFAWFKANSKGEDPPVGKKKPNPWGLYDMHGYVWEWCQDSWHPDYKEAPKDGRAWEDKHAKSRVVRGGSWGDPADRCRSASRQASPTEQGSDTVGFRYVRATLVEKR